MDDRITDLGGGDLFCRVEDRGREDWGKEGRGECSEEGEGDVACSCRERLGDVSRGVEELS